MAAKGSKDGVPLQHGSPESSVQIIDPNDLPWIMAPALGAIEVRAPGSVYEPLLLTPPQQNIEVRPGKLNEQEALFICDLVNYLYPRFGPAWDAQTPLKWGEREIWFKRNIENREDSFRVQVDSSDWFYPDFILWIIDRNTRTQTFGFIDPKGLQVGAEEGWGHYKVVSTLYMPHVIERRLGVDGLKVTAEGEEWTFRIRGVIVSTADYRSLSKHAKFAINNEQGKSVQPNAQDFYHGRIVFQENRDQYIGQMLDLLVHDSAIDVALRLGAAFLDQTSHFSPCDEADFDLLIRHRALGEPPKASPLVRDLILDLLKHPDPTQAAEVRRRRALEKLGTHASEGKPDETGGAEAVAPFRQSGPCAELWRRMQSDAG